MSHYFNNNINSLNTFNTFTVTDDRSKILAWLSPLEPRVRHQGIQDNRVEDVGEWLLQTEEFKSWYTGNGGGESDNAVLFCYGDPGVGKTYISSLVIDSLCDKARKKAAVACFYFDFATQKEQSPTSMLGALLKQVVGGLGEVPEEIVEAYEDQKTVIGGRAPRLSDIAKMLQATSSQKRTFICVDALDECAAEYRVKLLDSLDQIVQKSPGTRIFATGRPHILDEVARRISGGVTIVRITPKRSDIIGYLRTRLSEDTSPDAMDSNLEADILTKIPDDISEMFLLVSLNIDAILRETTIHRRRQKLNAMRDGLGLRDAYGSSLDRIKGLGGEKARLGMAALMWISHAERPLKSDELCHALAVEIGAPNVNNDNVPSTWTLLACCQGLVVVDKWASTVRLIHFTLQEYLRAHPNLFRTAHSTMAETCLSYLNLQQVKALSASPSPNLRSTPFLEYSSVYWGTHAKRDLSDCAKLLALKLFDGHNNHIPTQILLQAHRVYPYVDYDKLSLFSGIHWASMFGIVEIVTSLVEVEGCDINQADCAGDTPLVWAARGGHEGVVKILLGRGDVDPNKPGLYDKTPLLCAAGGGHEGVVEMLLGRDDINSNKPDNNGQTPLDRAAWEGREGVVKMLLGRDDVDPNRQCCQGRTSLCSAVQNGHGGVVNMLLQRGNVNPNIPGRHNRTPLLWAALHGDQEVVKMLLEQGDANPNIEDDYGETPLRGAVLGGHEGVVKELLGRDNVNPDRPGRLGLTPLCCAASAGYEGMVKMLLGRDDVKPDKPDSYGQTPLCRAAKNGHEGVVKMLLGRDDVNPDGPDNGGRTPLWWATRHGHARVRALLQPPESTIPGAN